MNEFNEWMNLMNELNNEYILLLQIITVILIRRKWHTSVRKTVNNFLRAWLYFWLKCCYYLQKKISFVISAFKWALEH